MAVVIRLTRQGSKKKPFYRVVAADRRAKRDGRFLEILGTYNPKAAESKATFAMDRVAYWISQGAVPSETVAKLYKGQQATAQ